MIANAIYPNKIAYQRHSWVLAVINAQTDWQIMLLALSPRLYVKHLRLQQLQYLFNGDSLTRVLTSLGLVVAHAP